MAKITVIFYSAYFLFSFQSQKMSLDKINNKPLYITNEIMILNPSKDGFYRGISASINERGVLVIYDLGNHKIHVYNRDYKSSFSFGKEGSGPGELSGNEVLFTTKNLIILKNNYKLMLYNYSGVLQKEIKVISDPGGRIVADNNGFILVHGSADYRKVLYRRYSSKGKLIESIPNPNNIDEAKKPKDNNYRKSAEKRFGRTYAVHVFNNGFIESYQLAYKFHHIDFQGNNKRVFHRKIERFKRKKFRAQMMVRGTDDDKKANQQIYDAEFAVTGGYYNDINALLGESKGHFFVRTSASDKYDLNIDMINSNFELVGVINKRYKDEIHYSTRVENDKLIVALKSDEIGPYLLIYDIEKS